MTKLLLDVVCLWRKTAVQTVCFGQSYPPEVNEEPKEEQKGLGPPETTEGNSTGAEKPTVLKLTRKGTTTSELEGESAV